jgi:carbon monoxide dehydrogenase subunit G
MRIESTKVDLKKSREEVFSFVSDFRNFEHLIPKDKVSKWTATEDSCSFNINGMADIGMKIQSTVMPSQVNIISDGKNPFDFTLTVFIEEKINNESIANLVFDAEVNPFLKMMVEKPLTNFFNMLAERLKVMFG